MTSVLQSQHKHYAEVINMLAPPTWRLFIVLTSKKHGISQRAILGLSRLPSIVAARHEAMALIYQHTKASKAAIGRYFGRDHTTVIHALNKLGVKAKLIDRAPLPTKPVPALANYRHKLRSPNGKFLPVPPRRQGRPLDGKGPSIRKGYINGVSVKDIAADLGISEGCVRVRAHRMGLTHPRPYRSSSPLNGLSAEQADDYLVFTQKGGYSAAEAMKKVVGK